ncbi:hypothetical protein SLS62_004661 [Diatrype stigma]|uniref:Uncharacterized protein n=1 Tax=Diatrype stigma TaxID=117547 RepID=A0AAN9USY1_9PEZI
MKFITSALSILAIGQAMASPDAVTIKIPAGFGANGTLVVDNELATKYLQGEAGVAIDKFLNYVKTEFDAPKAGVEYAFPAGSGLEASSITFDKDHALEVHQDSADMTDCDRCWVACILLAWFPPAWGICIAGCVAKGCKPQ